MKTVYTIEQVTEVTDDFRNYLFEEAPKISALFDNKLDYRNCPVEELIEKCIFLVGKKDGEIRGHMICQIIPNALDYKVKMLYQLSFYVKPNSGRTAYHLFHKFIDIGKDQANHIITMLTSHSNIKPSSLEKLGFKELETLYRMEII